MKHFFLLLILLNSTLSFATIHRIRVTNFQFSPKRINAIVGDTILWVYKSGFHTTTSTTIPAGAAPWDSPMDVNTTRYRYVLKVPGLYNYICLPHSAEMKGVIRVFRARAVSVSSFAIKAGLNGSPEIAWGYKSGSTPRELTLYRSYDMIDFERLRSFQKSDTVTRFRDNSVAKNVFAYYFLQTIDANGDTAETAIKMYVSTLPEKIITSLSPTLLQHHISRCGLMQGKKRF